MSLGADSRSILALVLGRALRLAAAGVGLGLAVAAVAGRVLRSLLYEVSPSDPAVFVLVPPLLVGVVVLAAYVPARKATRIPAASALRQLGAG